MAYQQREEGKMTEYYCNYIKEPQISGVYSHLNNGVVVDFNNLVQVLTMTLVTEANFWKSKVRSEVTYMFRAMDARLHTATCRHGFRDISDYWCSACYACNYITNVVWKWSQCVWRENTTFVPHPCWCIQQSLCIDCCTWLCQGSADCSCGCRHLYRACRVCPSPSETLWWRTTPAVP